MIEFLDGILLSDNACQMFLSAYNDLNFKEWIDRLIPEVYACLKQSQNTPWHIYNVLEHSLHSVEEMNRLTAGLPDRERRLLAYVMFFHDLGKPACHWVTEVDGKLLDHFTFHNFESEKIAKRVVPQLGFGEEDALKIVVLVREHDVYLKLSDHPQQEWQIKLTTEFLRSYIKELDGYGDGLMQYLILVGIADNRAQNPVMTGPSLAFVKRVGDMANQIIREEHG